MIPNLSVITICFNNLRDLIATCRSVDEQTHKPTEHLIVDGSTNEEILNWLSQTGQPGYRRWIHERDKGISDAFNKGITRSTGQLTHLLNSGDQYAAKNAIETALSYFEKDPRLQWTHSQYIQHRGNMDVITGLSFKEAKLWKGMRTVAHPSMFIKREVYDRHGLYDTGLKIAMDYDMLVRMRKERFRFIASPLVYFAPGGASNRQFKKGLSEVKESYTKHIGGNMRLRAWQLRQRLLNTFMKTGLGTKWFRWKNRKDSGQ